MQVDAVTGRRDLGELVAEDLVLGSLGVVQEGDPATVGTAEQGAQHRHRRSDAGAAGDEDDVVRDVVGQGELALGLGQVHDLAERRVHGDPDGVGDGVADVVRLKLDLADAERLPHGDLAEVGALVELVLLQLRADESERQLRAVDRCRHLPEEVRERADVILMGVGDEDAAEAALPLPDVGEVGDDDVDPEHLLLGEHEAGVDEDEVVVDLQDERVAADLAQAAERDDPDGAQKSVGCRTGAGSSFFGGGALSAGVRSRKSESFRKSATSCSRSDG